MKNLRLNWSVVLKKAFHGISLGAFTLAIGLAAQTIDEKINEISKQRLLTVSQESMRQGADTFNGLTVLVRNSKVTKYNSRRPYEALETVVMAGDVVLVRDKAEIVWNYASSHPGEPITQEKLDQLISGYKIFTQDELDELQAKALERDESDSKPPGASMTQPDQGKLASTKSTAQDSLQPAAPDHHGREQATLYTIAGLAGLAVLAFLMRKKFLRG